MLFKKSFTLNFSQGFALDHTFIPELLGMIVIVIFTLNWLKNKLSKASSEDEEIKKEITKKPTIETNVLYIAGFLVFGLLSVRAIIAL